ncbi:MAG: metallophosphoesterase family protein [Anaerolineaceae bacterium]|nr:metallophosphoesterase family protein [Anaerolineaceae bacterium]
MQCIAILSDIHGNLPALEVVTADLQARQVDTVINLGDHLSGPLWPAETAQFLMQQDWIHIRGNHDRCLVEQDPKQHGISDQYAYEQLNDEQLSWLKEMPASVTLEEEILAIHGSPGNDKTYLLESISCGRTNLASPEEIEHNLQGVKPQVLLCGHTHIPRVVKLMEKMLIVNPGSVGLPAYDDEEPEYHITETGSPHARYAIIEKKNDLWQVELINLCYENVKAVQQAAKNNQPGWALALQTGFMRG